MRLDRHAGSSRGATRRPLSPTILFERAMYHRGAAGRDRKENIPTSTLEPMKRRARRASYGLLGVLLAIWCVPSVVSAQTASSNRDTNPFATDPFHHDEEVESVPEGQREHRAEELSRQGRAAFEAHHLEEAARLLDQAYRLGGDPNILYYLALSLHEMGHYDAAEERLRRYMELVPLDPGQRYTLHLQLENWRRQFSRVSIETEPEGARLSLGGEEIGTTPLPRPLVLPNGTYQLEVELPGYESLRRELIVPGGEPVELSLRLRPLGADRLARRRRRLATGFWISLGVTIASGVALAVTGVLAARANADLEASEYPMPDLVARTDHLQGATYGLTSVTGAGLAATVTLGVLWLLSDNGEGDAD